MRATIFAILAGTCWAVGEVFAKSVLHTKQVGPLAAIAVRSTIALPVLWAVYLVVGRHMKADTASWWQADTPTLLRLILGAGLAAGAGGMAFFYLALSYGDVGKVKPIAFALAPALGAVLGWLTLGEPMDTRKALGIAVIILGVILLAWK